jgi:hypothetical protein
MARRRRTSSPHTRSFATAPRVAANEAVRLIRHDERSPGWFYGVTPQGAEGYFPTSWFQLDEDGGQATALRDYDAVELTIDAGVEIDCLDEAAGWLLVRTVDGREGWIPSECAS